MKRDLSLSDQQLGWIGSAYIIVLALAALPLGAVADLKSRRGVIAWGVGLWSVATAAGGLARRFWELFFGRAVVGIGEAGYGPASQALIAEYYHGKRRAMAIGIYSVGMALGGVVGVWLGGVLAERYGWREAFLATGAPGAVLAVLASRLREPRGRRPESLWDFVRRTRRGVRLAIWYVTPVVMLGAIGAAIGAGLTLFTQAAADTVIAVFAVVAGAGIVLTVRRLVPAALRRTSEATHIAAGALEDFGEAAATVLRIPTLIWVFAGGALVTFCVNGLIAWAPAFMARVHGLAVSDVGRLFGVWGLSGGALGALAGGRLGDSLLARWPGARVFVSGAGFLLGTPVCAALILVPTLRGYVPLIFTTYFFYTMYNGPLAAVILDVVPAAVRASVLGAFVLFSHLAGDALAPPLVGYLSDRFGLRAAMLVLPAGGLAGGLVLLGALKTVRRDMARVRGHA